MLDSAMAAELVAATEQVVALTISAPAVVAVPVAMAGEALEEALLRLGVPFPGQGDDT